MPITADGPDIPDVAKASHLSEEKKFCLRGVLVHMTNAQIAAEAGLSPRKVEALIRSAVRDLGVNSRTEAALLLAAVEGRFPTLETATTIPSFVREREAEGPGRAMMPESHFGPIAYSARANLDVTVSEHGGPYLYEAVVGRNEPPDLQGEFQHQQSDSRIIAHQDRNTMSIRQRILFILFVSFVSAVMMTCLAMTVVAIDSLR